MILNTDKIVPIKALLKIKDDLALGVARSLEYSGPTPVGEPEQLLEPTKTELNYALGRARVKKLYNYKPFKTERDFIVFCRKIQFYEEIKHLSLCIALRDNPKGGLYDFQNKHSSRKVLNTPAFKYFKSFEKYINKYLKKKIFKSIGRIVIFYKWPYMSTVCHADYYRSTGKIPKKNYSMWPTKEDKDVYKYINGRDEFISFDPFMTHKLYVIDDPVGKKRKIYNNSYSYWFNNLNFHGSEASPRSSFHIRVDGVFSDVFRKLIKAEALKHDKENFSKRE